MRLLFRNKTQFPYLKQIQYSVFGRQQILYTINTEITNTKSFCISKRIKKNNDKLIMLLTVIYKANYFICCMFTNIHSILTIFMYLFFLPWKGTNIQNDSSS